jgi:hypothetical protein
MQLTKREMDIALYINFIFTVLCIVNVVFCLVNYFQREPHFAQWLFIVTAFGFSIPIWFKKPLAKMITPIIDRKKKVREKIDF